MCPPAPLKPHWKSSCSWSLFSMHSTSEQVFYFFQTMWSQCLSNHDQQLIVTAITDRALYSLAVFPTVVGLDFQFYPGGPSHLHCPKSHILLQTLAVSQATGPIISADNNTTGTLCIAEFTDPSIGHSRTVNCILISYLLGLTLKTLSWGQF